MIDANDQLVAVS